MYFTIAQLAAQSRARQLEKRCELQEEELDRLRSKVDRMDIERQQRDKRVSEIFQELRRGKSKSASSTSDKRLVNGSLKPYILIDVLGCKVSQRRKSTRLSDNQSSNPK